MAAELPAVWIPAAHATGARSDPDEACWIAVQRHDERVAERIRVGAIVRIVYELARFPIEQLQALCSAHPEVARLIVQHGAHVI